MVLSGARPRRLFLYAIPTAVAGATALSMLDSDAEASSEPCGTGNDVLGAVRTHVNTELRLAYRRGKASRQPRHEDARIVAANLRLLAAVGAFDAADAAIKREIDTFGGNAANMLTFSAAQKQALLSELQKPEYTGGSATLSELDQLFAEPEQRGALVDGATARQQLLDVVRREGFGRAVTAIADAIAAESRRLDRTVRPVGDDLVSDDAHTLVLAQTPESCRSLRNQIYLLEAAMLAASVACAICAVQLGLAALALRVVYDNTCQ